MTVTLSLHAELERPIPRVRADRAFVELDRMTMPQSWLRVIANGIGLAMFMGAVIFVVMHG